MNRARRIQLLREIRDGQNRLAGGTSMADHAGAMAKLAEWQCLAQRMDLTLRASYKATAGGPRLDSAAAVLTPSGSAALEESERAAQVRRIATVPWNVPVPLATPEG